MCQTTTQEDIRLGSCKWLQKPIYPCTILPAGLPGLLKITSFTKRGTVSANYEVSIHFDAEGKETGYTLANQSNGQSYSIDPYSWGWDQASCDCGDNTFRSRTCKHAKALKAGLKAINLL